MLVNLSKNEMKFILRIMLDSMAGKPLDSTS